MANTNLIKAFAFLFTSGAGIMWSMDGQCCSTGALEDKAEVCCFSFYKNGSNCKACPAGYYGKNCKQMCPPLLYGLGCKHHCDCSPCHHIYGCATSLNTVETPTHGNKAEYDNSTQKPTSRKNTGRILIISAGAAISLALVLIILHELVTYRQMSTQINVHQAVNNVYDDIGDVDRVA